MIAVEYDSSGYWGDWAFKGVFTSMTVAREKALEWALNNDDIDMVEEDSDLEQNGFKFTKVVIDTWVPVWGDKDFVEGIDESEDVDSEADKY